MEIKVLAPCKLACIRVRGQYENHIPEAIEKVDNWASGKNLADAPRVHIFHDDPEKTPPEECRADIGIIVDENIQGLDELELIDLPGGKYATIRKIITEFSQYGKAWDELCSAMVESDLDMDDRPCFELYHSYDEEKNASDMSVCIAVK